MTEQKAFYNTLGDAVEQAPIESLLSAYPEVREPLAQAVLQWAREHTPLGVGRIQRCIFLRFEAAEAVMEALLQSGLAVSLHAPARVELCLEEAEARRFSHWLLLADETRETRERAREVFPSQNRGKKREDPSEFDFSSRLPPADWERICLEIEKELNREELFGETPCGEAAEEKRDSPHRSGEEDSNAGEGK